MNTVKRNYQAELQEIETAVFAELKELLKKHGGASEAKNPDFEFWEFFDTSNTDVEEIDDEGNVVGGTNDGCSLGDLVEEGDMELQNIVSLVESLRTL